MLPARSAFPTQHFAIAPGASQQASSTQEPKSAVDENDSNRLFTLAKAYFDGDHELGIQPDSTQALHYLELAANAGHPDALLELGEMHFTGTGLPFGT